MARSKYPEITRSRILEAATKLFLENGWEETTIQDIVDELGDVTRGAFYHHFESKDAIIDAVTTQVFGGALISLIKETDNLDVNGLNKLRQLFIATFSDTMQLQFVKTAPSVLQNPISIGKQAKECIDLVAPHICKLIEEGNHDGSIKVINPKQVSETFVLLLNLWLSPITFTVSREEYAVKLQHFKALFDGIGLPVMNQDIFNLFEKYFDYVVN